MLVIKCFLNQCAQRIAKKYSWKNENRTQIYQIENGCYLGSVGRIESTICYFESDNK